MKRFLKIIFFIMAGLLVCEMGMRTGGFLIRQRHRKSDRKEASGFRILCVGDSHTEGLGADPGHEYPGQLEKMLQESARDGKTFTVYNKGEGGQNTAQLAEKFEGYLEQRRPQLVIMLSGASNLDNYWGYGRYSGRGVFRFLLAKLRVIKAAQYFLKPLKEGPRAFKKREKDQNESAAGRQKEESHLIARKGYDYFFKGRYEQAVPAFREALLKDPGNSGAWNGLGRVYRALGFSGRAIEAFKKGIEADPASNYNYDGLSMTLRESGNYEEGIKYFQTLLKINPEAENYLQMFRKKNDILNEARNWVKSDLSAIISLCREKGIKVILMNYPTREIFTDLYKELAVQFGVPFIENYEYFNDLIEKEESVNRYFTRGRVHCNSEGYKILAQRIYARIKEEQYLP